MTTAFRSLLWLLCLSALTAGTSTTLQAQTAQRPTWVYRVDSIPPLEMFMNGAQSEGLALNLLEHARGQNCSAGAPAQRSGWLSTTSDRQQAERFLLRRFERASQRGETLPPMWLYTIRTDYSYLHLMNVLQQAVSAGEDSLNGYTPAHAEVLQQLLRTSRIPAQAEVVTRRIDSRRVMYAERISYEQSHTAGWQLVRHPGTSNTRFQAPAVAAQMNNYVEDLHHYLPPRSIAIAPSANGTCFQSCDRASHSHRLTRSPSAAGLDYCQAEPSAAQALIGSDD